MKILVFGNVLLKDDSLPIKLIPFLKKEFPKIDFVEIDTVEEITKFGYDLIIIDTVQGIKKTILIENLDSLETNKSISVHDFDLSFNLKLLKKINLIKSVKIIGVPQKISKEKALEQIKKIIKSISV